MSKTSAAVKARWNRKNYDRLTALFPIGKKELFKKFAEEHGTSMNGMINDLLRYEMGIPTSQWKKTENSSDENP